MSLPSIRYRSPVRYNPSGDENLSSADLWDRRKIFAQKRNINIRHPAYPSDTRPLLSFPPFDNDGVDYDLVIYACYILVQHDFHANETPYLSYSKEPRKDVISPSSVIITRDCFLHVPAYTGPQPYPITPSFDHWKLSRPRAPFGQPPAGLPPAWREASISDDYIPAGDSNSIVYQRDGTCRVTDHFTGLEPAHLVPIEASSWLQRNGMESRNNTRNMILLRADIRVMLDCKEILIMPKKIDGQYRFVLKVIKSHFDSYDLVELYHNRICQELRGIGSEYIFGRFAWNIFNSQILQFTGTPRLRCKVLVYDQADWKYKVQDRLASDFCSDSEDDEDKAYQERLQEHLHSIGNGPGEEPRGRKRTR